MRYLFAARHGDYEGDPDSDKDKLTSFGEEQIKHLAKTINNMVGSNPICLASTHANRVVQSAGILQQELNIKDYFKVNEQSRDLPELYAVKKELYHAMIFVSHECPTAENASYVAALAGYDKKSIGDIRYFCGLGTGRALILDLEQKTFTIIPEIEKPVIKKVRTESFEDIPLVF